MMNLGYVASANEAREGNAISTTRMHYEQVQGRRTATCKALVTFVNTVTQTAGMEQTFGNIFVGGEW